MHVPGSGPRMSINEFIQLYRHVEWVKAELEEMISQPLKFTPEQVEWKRTSLKLFEALINCHFYEGESSDEWE